MHRNRLAAELTAFPNPLAGFNGPLCDNEGTERKGRKGREWNGKGTEGKEGKEGRGQQGFASSTPGAWLLLY